VFVMSVAVNDPSTTQLESKPPLRRATYVHVSDLTNAYNIDHAVLDQELSRVKAERAHRTGQEAATAAALAASVDSAIEAPDLDPEVSPQKRLQPPKGGYNLCVYVTGLGTSRFSVDTTSPSLLLVFMHGSLVGKVTVVVDKKRVDQSRVRLAEVEVGDETGIVSLRARDDQIDILQEVSGRDGAIVLRNCTLELYQGKHIRLAVTKWGKLSLYPDNVASTPLPPSKMNLERDYSAIDLSVVASEMAEQTPDAVPYGGRQAKQQDVGDTGSTMNQKPTNQIPKPAQSSTRRGGREKRHAKSKQGKAQLGTPQPYYGLYPYEHATAQPRFEGQMRGYPNVHPYQRYDQPMDPLQQYHYPQHQEQHIMGPVSAQQVMMPRQYDLQHLQHMYQGHQESSASTGMAHSPPPVSQGGLPPAVPAASFDMNEYNAPSFPSASSPILIPKPLPPTLDHSRRTPMGLRARGEGDSLGSLSSAHETHTPQYVSVSPDDSSQLSARMNPEAVTFAPAYLGAAQGK